MLAGEGRPVRQDDVFTVRMSVVSLMLEISVFVSGGGSDGPGDDGPGGRHRRPLRDHQHCRGQCRGGQPGADIV